MRIRDWSSDVCSSDLGTGPTPFNAEGGVRVSTASAYLGADVRRRPNLTILANMAVRHIVFEERRAVAIATESGAIFKGAMIVASAGECSAAPREPRDRKSTRLNSSH